MLRPLLAVCLALTSGVGLAAAAAPSPLWSCPGKDVPHYKKVNDCRAGCATEASAAETRCREERASCAAACGDSACRQKCLETAETCIKDGRAKAQTCLDACVTDNGCTL